ncbi:uncharacterized protein LTR77_002865 [Saxophila tyrrhenica]|uniref:ER-bound oxygenase mpaB/mpaB'/Rubber oxygenase catalytic domain-containing protein n=1 Tax=Saxophila tyrrhenica TaxID=1690608 RepID=A0AAV9PJG4_9PEZI|nr:hypothetical protein LTR77_002865 [Saxophila tyrrhenica]
MTLEEAFEIQNRLAVLEFPIVFSVSVFFALFKTYGIPSISKLLVQTGQLADEATASKRAADTGVVLTEVILHHPSSPRAIDGIARMNYLHSTYRKAGKISDADMLYTLSLFALEPIRWTDQYEWRKVNEVERCAMGTYWRYMADAMEIPLTLLHSHKSGWTDGLHFLDELEEWSIAYEAGAMVPAKSNYTVARGTVEVGLFNVPRRLRPMCMPFVSALLSPHLRKAMMFPDPPQWTTATLDVLVCIRKVVLRYLCLPRPYFLRERWWSERASATGRYHAKQFISLPWYVKPTLWARWSPKAWLLRLVRSKVPGDDGGKYHPEGYIISELGPESHKGKGLAEMKATQVRLKDNKTVGCPFARW